MTVIAHAHEVSLNDMIFPISEHKVKQNARPSKINIDRRGCLCGCACVSNEGYVHNNHHDYAVSFYHSAFVNDFDTGDIRTGLLRRQLNNQQNQIQKELN